MKDPSRYYVISDLHLGHQKIINFVHEGTEQVIRANPSTGKPFDSIQQHDEYLIAQWNATVNPGDTVYFLGDLAFDKKHLAYAGRLNGRKIIIPGNHDIFPAKDYLAYFDDVRSTMVRDGIIFTHVPVHPECVEFRFKLNVHGHIHHTKINNPKYYNVCLEHLYHRQYKPIPLTEILQYRNTL